MSQSVQRPQILLLDGQCLAGRAFGDLVITDFFHREGFRRQEMSIAGHLRTPVAILPGNHLRLVLLVAYPEQGACILTKCDQVMGPFQQYLLPRRRACQQVPVEPGPQRFLVKPFASIGRQRLRPAQTGPRLWLGIERAFRH